MPGQEGGVLSGPDIGPQQAALLPPWPLDSPSEIELSWRVTDDQPWRRQPNGASKGQLSLQREGKPQHLICDPEKLLREKGQPHFNWAIVGLCFQSRPQATMVLLLLILGLSSGGTPTTPTSYKLASSGRRFLTISADVS